MVETRAMLEVRPEAEPDHDAIRRVHEHAFAPSPEEARLVDAWRFAGDLVLELCLGAEEGGEVVSSGHPGYYPRFGFEPGAAFGVVDPVGLPPEAWMVHLLPAYTPEARGRVRYAEAFSLGG
jgi:predicted N-acetyltransferase YhbS